MATVDDIGVPGQPLSTPPLTAWQAAVRDAVKTLQAGDQWTAWSPTLTACTAQTVDARYNASPSGLVSVEIMLTVATVTGTPTIGFPPGLVPPITHLAGATLYVDTSAGAYWAGQYRKNSSAFICLSIGSTHQTAGVTSTVPFTWAAGDIIALSSTYRVDPTL